MSRAINVNATQAEVIKFCARHGAAVSAIETLASGGTRVVLMNIIAAETMRAAFGRKLLAGTVRRTPLRTWAL
ncbi:hypothetical protein KV697_17030 [Sphingomonas sanguinis]|uniref:hypothetical protein n=1 Tax=Sphingomonas sanguinis TaxID=33051 RepID=UPI001C58E59B|nr:hypothetical protein [Sphingomonas sanguinis]QXT35416.1 hypothetical protein KV697_17030 [Sphingomonas sanguinis]